jgi:hypothetical protein
VVLQRDRGRQVLGFADITRPSQLDIMLERGGGQNLDADVVGDEVFESQRWTRVAVSTQRGARRPGVAVSGVDLANAESEKHVALLLRKRGRGNSGEGRGESEGCERFHGLFLSSHARPPRRTLRPGQASRLDLGQVARAAQPQNTTYRWAEGGLEERGTG